MASFPGENHLEEPGGAIWFRKQGKVVEVGGGKTERGGEQQDEAGGSCNLGVYLPLLSWAG